jgi:hypothetical protein
MENRTMQNTITSAAPKQIYTDAVAIARRDIDNAAAGAARALRDYGVTEEDVRRLLSLTVLRLPQI